MAVLVGETTFSSDSVLMDPHLGRIARYSVPSSVSHSFEEFSFNGQGSSVSLHAETVPGIATQANEDSYFFNTYEDGLLAGVFDGVTNLQPVFDLQHFGVTGARFAAQFLKEESQKQAFSVPLPHVLEGLNTSLYGASARMYNISLLDPNTLPAATAALVKINFAENRLEVGQVSDAFVLVQLQDGSTHRLTPDTNARFEEEAYHLIRRVASDMGITSREAAQLDQVKEFLIRQRLYKDNRADGDGTGLLNGSILLGRYLFSNSFPLDRISAVFIGTDGIVPPGWDIDQEEDRRKLFDTLRKGGTPSLVAEKKAAEEQDPDWEHTRFKDSDDATGVFLDLNRERAKITAQGKIFEVVP